MAKMKKNKLNRSTQVSDSKHLSTGSKMKSKRYRKVGQAPALSRAMWQEWIDWMQQHAGARMAVILSFTGNFGLRCSEALALKVEDIHIRGDVPKITVTGDTPGARKSPGDVYVRKRNLQWLQDLLKHGVKVDRRKKHKHGKGKKKQVQFQDTYQIPKSGYLFKSRRNAGRKHLHYQAVYRQVKQQAPRFLEHLKKSNGKWAPEIAKLRPHSGRATLITELMGEGLSTALSMKYASFVCKSCLMGSNDSSL
jgi:integrase